MQSVRVASLRESTATLPCCRCANDERNWDRIIGKAYCPECQEALVLGLTAPLIERAEANACAACNRVGTARYLTFPLHSSTPIEIDLCPEHLRRLLGRRLGPHAFRQIRRRLSVIGIGVERIFLLHDAFYDRSGRAIQPAHEVE